jgi:hypothetical protein
VLKNFPILYFLLFFAMNVSAQAEQPVANEVDSLKVGLKEKGIRVEESVVSKEKFINPLAPSKAAFYSSVLPGMGQIYNKRYWKAPIVWGALAAGIYGYTFYDGQYNDLRTAFKRRRAGFTDDEFYDLIPSDGITPLTPDVDNARLERLQNDRQNDRDLALLATIILYALNVVDANVDAHLKQYNISDDLSWKMNIEPYLNNNPINNDPNYGLALTIKF